MLPFKDIASQGFQPGSFFSKRFQRRAGLVNETLCTKLTFFNSQ